MNENVFLLRNGGRLKIGESALLKMLEYRQDTSEAKEAGGILVGRFLLESPDYIIDDVSIPMENDVRKRYRFSRSPKGHQEFFNQKWAESQGRCFYLGEWHTHPEHLPIPSLLDLNDWKRIMCTVATETESIFFIIIGIEKIRVWEGIVKERKLYRLDLNKEE